MKRVLLITLIVSFLATVTTAQTVGIKGTLIDNTDSTILSGATVSLLLQSDSSLVKSIVTNATGSFDFNDLVAESFILKITSVGYQEYISFITLKNEARDLGVLRLNKQGKDLSVVTIIAKAAATAQKGDTTEFSASQYKVNPDATTEDLIKKMPGVTVAKDGTVTAQGEQVKKVTIDGKDFFGDDASAALKNLPSQVVDKIQVFDKLSDQAQLTGFDDGNSVKAINIVTKSGIKNGQFGRVYAGYGTDSRYSAGGNMSFFNGNRRLSFVGNFNNINQQNFGSQDLLGVSSSGGGSRGGRGGGSDNFTVGQASGISKINALGVNYSDQWGKKVSISGSYFFNNSTNNNDYLEKKETLGDIKQFSTQNGFSTTKSNNHRINLRLEYKIDSSNSIFIIPSINFQDYSSNSSSLLQTINAIGDSVNNSFAKLSSKKNGYNIRNSILYRHSFPKKGRTLTLGFNSTFNKNDGESITDAYYRYFGAMGSFDRDSSQNQYADNNTNGHSLNGRIGYTEPLGKNSQFQVDYNYTVQKNKADQATYLFDNGKYSLFDTTLSNKFDNTITTNNAGLNYRYSPNRDQQLSFGINFQSSELQSQRTFPTMTGIDQRFTNVLPSAFWRKKFSKYSNIRIFYRASTDFPSVNQLQDVVDLSNPLSVSSGNPALKQSYKNRLGGRYTYTNTRTNHSFFANIFLQTASDYISNASYYVYNDSTIQQGIVLRKGSQLSKPVNLDGYKNLSSFFTYSTPIKFIKTTINVNAGFQYSKLPGLVNNVKTNTDNFVYNAGVVFASNISEYVDFNLSYNASFNNAKTTSANITNNNYVNQTAGLQMNLLSKKGWFVQNDVSNQSYSGLSGGLNQSYWLWNAAIGKKFLKNKAGELKLSVFDLLKQNQSIVRTVSETAIVDTQSQVLQQYFMLTFTYSLKNFGTGKAGSGNDEGGRGAGGRGF